MVFAFATVTLYVAFLPCEDRFLVQAVPVAPFSRGNAVDVLKGSGKMQGVLIAHGVSDVADGEGGQLEQLRRLCHAEVEQKFLRCLSDGVLEDLAEVGAVQSADRSNILHRDVVLEVVFNVFQCLVDVEIPQRAVAHDFQRSSGTHQIIQKEIEVSDEVEGRGIAVFNDVQHLALHLFPQLLFAGVVDGRVQRKSGSLQHSLGTQSVELDPEVFPWGLVVGDVRGDLSGEDHEPLHAPDIVGDGLPFGIVRHKRSHTGEHIVEQEVVSARRPERMGRRTAFHAELEQPQIDEIFVGKYGEYQVFHL